MENVMKMANAFKEYADEVFAEERFNVESMSGGENKS